MLTFLLSVSRLAPNFFTRKIMENPGNDGNGHNGEKKIVTADQHVTGMILRGDARVSEHVMRAAANGGAAEREFTATLGGIRRALARNLVTNGAFSEILAGDRIFDFLGARDLIVRILDDLRILEDMLLKRVSGSFREGPNGTVLAHPEGVSRLVTLGQDTADKLHAHSGIFGGNEDGGTLHQFLSDGQVPVGHASVSRMGQFLKMAEGRPTPAFMTPRAVTEKIDDELRRIALFLQTKTEARAKLAFVNVQKLTNALSDIAKILADSESTHGHPKILAALEKAFLQFRTILALLHGHLQEHHLPQADVFLDGLLAHQRIQHVLVARRALELDRLRFLNRGAMGDIRGIPPNPDPDGSKTAKLKEHYNLLKRYLRGQTGR